MANEEYLDYEAQEQEDEEGRRRRLLPWLILFIIFAVVIWLLWTYGGWRDSGKSTSFTEVKQLVSVPDLIGVDLDEAERVLGRLGLIAEVEVSGDAVGAPGTVSDQDPGSGAQVREGSTVRISVVEVSAEEGADLTAEPDYTGEARGLTGRTRTVATATVPDVVGLTEAEAKARAEAAGFVLRPMYQPRSWGESRVYQQQPAAGATAERGFQIHVLIMIPE